MCTQPSHLESNEYTVKVEELWGRHECNGRPMALRALLLHLKSNLGFLYFIRNLKLPGHPRDHQESNAPRPCLVGPESKVLSDPSREPRGRVRVVRPVHRPDRAQI